MQLLKIQSVFSQIRFKLQEQKLKILPIPTGKYSFVLIYAYKIDPKKYQAIVNSFLSQDFFVLFVSTCKPTSFITHSHLIHIQVNPRFMGMTTFSYSTFKKISGVVGLDLSGHIEATRVNMTFNVPLIDFKELKAKPKPIEITNSTFTNYKILFDTNYDASGRGLGDILMSTAVIKQIRKNYPNAHITYSTRPEAKLLLENNPNIDELITKSYIKHEFEQTLSKYEKHFFLGKATEDYSIERNRQPRIDSMAEFFNLTLENKTPEIFLTKDEIEFGRKFIDSQKHNVVFCIEASGDRRRIKNNWLLRILQEIKKCGYNIIVVGKNKTPIPKWVNNLTGQTTIKELFSIINLSDLIVTADNFVSHVAAAFNKREIILYTTIPAEWRCKYYDKAIGIQSKISCSPCWNGFKFEDKKCINNEKCVDAFDVKEISEMISENFSPKISQVNSLFEPNLPKPKTMSGSSGTKKAILVKMSSGELGDKLVALGLMNELKKKYKDYRLDIYIHSERYNSKNGYATLFIDGVDNCFVNLRDIKYSIYDRVFEISPFGIHNIELESVVKKEIQLSRYQRWAKQLDITFMGEVNAKYIVRESDWQNRSDLPKFNKSNRPLIGITPLTSNVAKNWFADDKTQFDKWQQVIDNLSDKGCNVVTLHHSPLKYRNCSNFGNLSPRELGYMVSKLDLLIGCEAGTTHFAGILKIPMIVLVGSSSPIVLRHYNNVRILHRGNCYSCNRFISLQFDKCECGSVSQNPESECLNLVTVSDVINEVKDFKGEEFAKKYKVKL